MGREALKKEIFIEDIFNNQITERERRQLATLIYYPEEKLAIIKKAPDFSGAVKVF